MHSPTCDSAQSAKIWTTANCCGHKTIPGSIMLEDGRVLVILDSWGEADQVVWQRGEQ